MSGRLNRDKQVGQVRSVSVHNRTVQFQRKTGDKQQEREGVSGIRRERRVDRRDGGEDGRVGNRKDSGPGGKGRQGTLLLNQKCDTDTKLRRYPSFSFPKEDPDLLSCMLPSYSKHLFTCLQSLRDEGLLLDCTFPFQNNSFQAHRLVMASASQTPDAYFGLKQKPFLEVEEIARCLTPVGLRAVLDFSYCGDVVVDVGKDGIMEEVLNACKCLEMERLKSKCMSKFATSAAEEIEKSLTVIRDLWERGVGCDVTIQAESGERYPAHRVVLAAGGDYFRALLCGGLRESREDVVCLRGVASWVIESILGFIYTGQLRLGWRQIWDLTDALLQFQLQGALSLCIDFLRERMDENTCLDVLVLAETYGLIQLGRAAEDYILAHFQCISAGEKFKDVPYPILNRLLEKDSLCIESEIVVFNAVVSWVEDNPKERLPFLPDLLLLVRLPLLSSSELERALRCNLLRRSPGAKETLETIRSLLNGDYRGPDCQPRTPNYALVLVGGDTVDDEFMRRVPNHTLWYIHQLKHGPGLIRNIEWKPLAKLPEPARFRHSVCLLNNKLYILGGRMYYGSLDILKSAVRFDLTECKWERLPDMLCQRDYFSAVCLEGKVFALGGNRDDSQYLDAVEYYTPEENAWRRAHSLDTAICGHAAAVLDGQIYISGGCDLHHRCLPTMWHYHPSRGCSPRAPMTAGAGRAGHVMLALGRGLVVAGGLQPLWMGFGDQLLCELYDPKQDSWSSIPALPRPHLSPGATVLDGRLYVVGGSSADTARDTKWVHRYDPKEKCWEKLGAMPHPYTDLAACTLPLLHLND